MQQMKREVIILATAKLADDWILVGIARSSDISEEWIRLRKAGGKISESDLKFKSGERIQPLDIVSMEIAKSGSGHDYTWDTSAPTELLTRLEAESRTSILHEFAKESIRRVNLKSEPFALIGPIYPTAIFSKSGTTSKAMLIAPELGDDQYIQVDDPKWLALGESILRRSNEMVLDSDFLERTLGVHKLYTVVGADGDDDFSVLCVHTIPDYSTELYFPIM